VLGRRSFLVGAGLVGAAVAGCAGRPDNGPVRRRNQPEKISYGRERVRFGELPRPPEGRPAGTIVIIHGGFWRAQYDLSLGRPLAADLAEHGFTCWNLEYRRVGAGGGWPTTLADVAAGIDHLAELDVDSSRVVAVGHSAGGQLAVWAAGRAKLPPAAPGAGPLVGLTGVVSQAGVLDLVTAARTQAGAGAVHAFLGGGPDEFPDRYRLADPIQQVPIDAPVLCLHSRADDNVRFAQSEAYVRAATAAGGHARLDETTGDHFTLIDPASPDWAAARAALPALLAGELP